MVEQTVPTLSLVGMIFTLVVCVGLPVALLIVFKKKLKANILSFLVGCVTFVLFAMVLESLMHSLVFTIAPNLQSNIWLYAVYGGLAAGLFEETGRWVAMKFVLRKKLNKENSLMYGAGHGGIEAVLIAGLAAVSNLAAAMYINAGTAAAVGLADETVAQMCIYPSGLFFLSGVERISAIGLHIGLSYIVYRAIKDKKPAFYFLAVGIHFAVDAGTLIINQYSNVYVLEAIVLAEVLVLWYFVYRMYKNEKSGKQPEITSEPETV